MTKPKIKPLSKHEKLERDRLRKQEKYKNIKNDPDLYEKQKEKERARYLLRKEQKKICSIKEMAPRSQREQRKRWRKNSLKYLEKKREVRTIESINIENSFPPNESESMNIEEIEKRDPLHFQINENIPRRRFYDPKLLIRRLRYRHMKTVKLLKEEINKLKIEIKELKKNREQTDTTKDSVEKRVDALMKDVQGDRVEEIKKKLLFEESLSKNLKEEYQILDKKNKRPFMEKILKNRDRLKKYQVLGKSPFAFRTKVQKPIRQNALSNKIRCFFEDDANSSLAAGKKECVKINGIKVQKRYLRDNLANLHEKFSKEEIKVGYSTFCRNRPSWIVAPNTRDTCGCKLHTNVDLLIGALKKANIFNEGTNTELLKRICCSTTDENCLDRTCQRCVNRVPEYKEFSNDAKITYYEWLVEKQAYKGRDGKEKTTTVTVKKELEDYPRNIILKLESILPKFLTHIKNISVQYASIKELKENLKHDEILIHIDFSENYCLKHNTEIQSFHFGGSRGQISLHTGVLYYHNSQTKLISTQSFCTVSKCIQHDAASIRAHLDPILDMAKELVPALKVIHFLSDSPTSQYRNKYIFYMITKLNEKLPNVESITWNYQEAGHGKGAPDGIGAVVKRTADNYVKHGQDVGSFEDFVTIVSQNIKNVKIEVVEEDKILNTKFPQNIPTFKGTMNVHQVLWCVSLPHSVAFRKLSCFVCQSSYIPCCHHRHLGVLSIGVDSRTTCQSKEVEHDVFAPENIATTDTILCAEHTTVSELTNSSSAIENLDHVMNTTTSAIEPTTCEDTAYLNIDSPTIHNNISNIDDSVLLNEIDDQAFLSDSKNPSPQPIIYDTSQLDHVQILSNVPFDWQRYSFYNKKSRAFNQCDQEEFKKFISDTTSTESKKQIDKPVLMDIDSTYNFDGNNEGKDCNMEFDDGNRTEKANTIYDSNKENIMDKKRSLQDHNVGDWVIVQYQIKAKLFAYIGKITEQSNGTCTILFLKMSSSSSKSFSWPAIEDEDTIAESRILFVLSTPQINRRGQYTFNNLPQLNYR